MMHTGFWSMGGYAAYVWPSYGVALLVFGWNLWVPRIRRRALLRALSEDEEGMNGEGGA